jgi:hypothetical protein
LFYGLLECFLVGIKGL